MTTSTAPPERLGSLIKDIRFAMLTTRGADRSLHSRPMVIQDGGDDALWFFTGSATQLAAEIIAHPEVNVSYSDPVNRRYVSVSGQASAVDDRAVMLDRWRPAYAEWIPLGIDDPGLALLRVAVGQIEIWRSSAMLIGRPLDAA